MKTQALTQRLALLLAFTLPLTACKLFDRRSNFSSSEDLPLRDAERLRLAKEFERIKAMFPQQEFKDIASEIYARFEKIYSDDPESGLRQPALFYVLTSLPGSGKTKFVEEVATALGVRDQNSFKTIQLDANSLYLDVGLVTENGVTSETATAIKRSDSKVTPTVLLFDEYTLASSGAIADSQSEPTFNERLRAIGEKINAAGFEKKVQEIHELRNVVINATQLPDGQGVPSRVTEPLDKLYKEVRTLAEDVNSISRRISQVQDEEARSSTQEDIEKADENFTLLWEILGNGTIPRKDLTEKQSYGNSLKSTADLVRTMLIDRTTKTVELRIANLGLQEVLDKIDRREKELEQARRARSPQVVVDIDISKKEAGDYSYAPNTGPTPEEDKSQRQNDTLLTSYLEEKERYEREIRTLNNDVKEIDGSIEQRISSLKNIMEKIVQAFGGKTILAEAIRALNYSQEQLNNEQVEAALRDIASRKNKTYEEVKALSEYEEQSLLDLYSESSPADQLLALFKKSPQGFYKYYESSVANRATKDSSTRYAGATVIFLAGNVLGLQSRVISRMADEGKVICQDVLGKDREPENPVKSPKCLRLVAEKELARPETVKELNDALLAVLGGKAYEKAGLSTSLRPTDTNELAFQSRVGRAKFILPPSSDDYRNFLKRDLERVSQKFRSDSGGVPLQFNNNVIDRFLFPKYVDSYLGFRGINSKAANEFALETASLSQTIRALRITGEQQCAPQNGAINWGALNADFGIPTEVIVSAEVAKDGTVKIVYKGRSPKDKKLYRLAIIDDTKFVAKSQEPAPLSDGQRFLYSYYLAGMYGSIAVLMETLPTESIALKQTQSGIPLSAASPFPLGYDLRQFRQSRLFHSSLEVQSFIAGLANISSSDLEVPPEFAVRKVTIKDMISNLHLRLLENARVKSRTVKEILALDQNNDIVGRPLYETDPLLSELAKYDELLGYSEVDAIFKKVHNHYINLYRKNSALNAAVDQLGQLIASKMVGMKEIPTAQDEVTSDEIAEILRTVDIVPQTVEGAPGVGRCQIYDTFFKKVSLETYVENPAQVSIAEGVFGPLFGLIRAGIEKDQAARASLGSVFGRGWRRSE